VALAACGSEDNTCYGTDVLFSNDNSHYNSGFGYRALYSNIWGHSNTAIGYSALLLNTYGGENTAVGHSALFYNTEGYGNTAAGHSALNANTTGDYNTATGKSALRYNTTGDSNTASGHSALNFNTEGYANTAIGSYSLQVNSTGYYNTASGYWALNSNEMGNRNTADGVAALYNAKGSRNVALGFYAGFNITTGANNIMIGAGQKGKADDSGVIRIGASTLQQKAFIAGIRGVTTGRADAVPVVIDANGQLGTISSSRDVKEDIEPLGQISERLLALRPVTFRYKEAFANGEKPIQFGLIAEEVAESFPELVVYDANGKPETVAYHLLSTLLVNEFQKAQGVIENQAARLAILEAQSEELAQLKKEFAAMALLIQRMGQARMIATTH
jgi:hypothetical protein